LAAHPTGVVGDAWYVNPDLYIWNEDTGTWDNVGRIAGPQGVQAKSIYPKNSKTVQKWNT
jgi:hypothetical protein